AFLGPPGCRRAAAWWTRARSGRPGGGSGSSASAGAGAGGPTRRRTGPARATATERTPLPARAGRTCSPAAATPPRWSSGRYRTRSGRRGCGYTPRSGGATRPSGW
ncbi:unnamed protein product, partial [Prorocentrum cordatum]